MSVHPTTGEHQSYDTITLKASGSETASTNGAAVFVGDKGTLRLTLDVTVDNGTTLDVVIQTSMDGTTWRAMNPVAAFAQIGIVGSERKCFPGCDRYARYVSTIVGTAFTYSIIGEAV
jgi:hypothetical protein